MIIKDFVNELDKRLDIKCSWGQKEVKQLVRDLVIEMYEKEVTDGTTKTDNQKQDK